ncbi:MAG: leucyl/phenylalanyl-tRNA--protein transferase [Phycisphaerales bacterium]
MDPIEGLLAAYREGFFPMGDSARPGPLTWLNPERRGVIPLWEAEGFHVPRRLAKRLRGRPFEIVADEDFGAVIRACAEPRKDETETWIDSRILALYEALAARGHAHSVEARLGPERTLVGGLYGVHIGGAFFAESKFSRPEQGGTDASKACLAHLMWHLRRRGFRLLDVQFWTPHLSQFGCVELARAAYRRELREALKVETAWGPFEAITA